MIKHILFPTDGSQKALNALDYVIELAKQLSAKVTIIHAFEFPVETDSISWIKLLTDFDKESMKKGLVEQSEDFISQAAHKLENEGITVNKVISEKRAGNAIVETAKKENCSLIVINSQGYSKNTNPLMGSVAYHVLHHAPCPVMIINE